MKAAPPGGNAPGNGSTGVILAIGASAAETGSLARVLTELPPDAGLAVVLALQHREALDEAGFRQALGELAGALEAAADGVRVEAGRIYLPAPGVILTLDEGRLRTRPAEQAPGGRGTIDSFFVSVAQDQDGKTIGLVLAGTNGDGTLGVTAIKEAGGLTLAEETADSEAGRLATSNSPAALADLVMPADELAGRIARQARHLARRQEVAMAEARVADLSEALAQIAAILRDRTGHDFHGYKRNTFLRRVQRRMEVAQAETIDSYMEILRTRPDEAQQLFNDLLIGVTQFFRDHREFEFLETQVIPKLFEGKGGRDQVRVWVLGCSTGEEAYSIAILLREFAATLDVPPHMQIFASDIDGRALAVARVGRYTQAIAKDMTPERLGRWFVKEGNTYCIVRELREMCIFSQHSVIRDTPFSRLDLVSCRNLLIYLDTDLQSRVIPVFHFALRPSGFLFLGNSESVAHFDTLFAPVNRSFRIFQKVETEKRQLPNIPFAMVNGRIADVPMTPRPRSVEHELVRSAERLADRYAPAYAIVNEEFDVLHFSARVGRYIRPAGGAASLNLLSLVHSDLRLDLRGALAKAAEEKRAARADAVQLGENGQRVLVDMIVELVPNGLDAPQYFVVLFKDGMTVAELGDRASPGTPAIFDERVRRLDAELRVSRERLQATIEELESTNEELKASNEEYQSLNEELQSANEELATSKEELQSVNEELTTVNNELAHRVEEIGRANSDLKNLLESTQIATIFLDNELRVMNFTPAITQLFHLIETDFGRPIAHIKSRIVYNELQEDVRRVVRTLGTVERALDDPAKQTRYMVRVLPYRSVDNFIAGAVVTFADVTALTHAQQALRESEARLREANERLEANVAERTAELMAAEEQLRQSQKMEAVGQLTGGIAHDFNNMLQGIGGSLELLQRRFEQGRAEEAGTYVESARRMVSRAAALTHRLLAFARRQTLQPKLLQPDALIEGMAELIRRTVGPGVQVELRTGKGIWPVLCDPNGLESILLNLAINARDAMPDGGTLMVSTGNVRLGPSDVTGHDGAKPGEYVEIAVADPGVGMDETTQARAFEPFFTTKPLGEGTGLGLSQLYGFVHQSDGIVRLESRLGQGTTVRLYLPRRELAAEGDARPGVLSRPADAELGEGVRPDGADTLPNGRDRAVLLVEDEAAVREAVADRLRDLGYDVLEAADGPEALRLLQGDRGADLLVTDVGLPNGLNGRQIADVARERRPGLPVLFITGYAGTSLEGQLAPGMAVIGKPFELDALIAQVQAMLGGHSLSEG